MRYRERQMEMEVDAIQWREYSEQVKIKSPRWFVDAIKNGTIKMYKVGWVYCMEIKTSEGPRIATLGDYVIRRPDGKIYTRRPWTFEKNYEKVEEHEGRQCKIDPRITKDTPVDELILVKNSESDEWQRAHFARMGGEDTVLAWEFGCTSFTASDYFSWEFAKMWEGSAEQARESEYASNEQIAEDVLKRAGEAITARNERLTVDMPVQKMGIMQLAHNLTFAKGGEIWLQNYDGEMKLRDLIRKIGSNHGIELPEEDNEFDETMFDMQQYDPCEGMEGLLAFLNFALIGYDDLRAELKSYEEAGEGRTTTSELGKGGCDA